MYSVWALTCLLLLVVPSLSRAAEPEQLAIVTDARINEGSGLAMSRRQPDTLWIHNDSGDVPRLFLVGLDGATRGVVHVRDSRAVDWEDMCAFTVDSTPWLLVGDVGDNSLNRHLGTDEDAYSACQLYLFPEPDMIGKTDIDIQAHTGIQFEYEDGTHNCESVGVDPTLGEVYVVTKTKAGRGDITGVYRMPLTLEPGYTKVTAKRIADLPIETVTAMDISADGRRMIVITGKEAILSERGENETWEEALKRTPRHMSLPPRNGGESVCFGRSANEILLHSEHTDQPLWSVMLPDETGK